MLDWSKTAFLFPGQGSQMVGMGKDLAELMRDHFEQADAIMGFALSRLMFEGPEAELNDTQNTQPALYVHSMALFKLLISRLPDAKPAYMAGHSLGELTALTAASALSFEQGLRLVRERGRLMHEAGETNPGAMAAILNLDRAKIEAICAESRQKTGKVVVVANDNCPGQVVISGDPVALEEAGNLAKVAGAKRVLPLAVSVATHSPLMSPAESEFKQFVAETQFAAPKVPIYANVSAALLTTPSAIRIELEHQLTHAVQWADSMRAMIEAGVETFIEIGARNVLTGLVRRIDSTKTGINLDTLTALEAFLAQNG